MKIDLLNKSSNLSIIIAGIISIIIGVGVARFSFTSLLPQMLDSYLSLSFAGVLASVNYLGYLSGSIFAIFIKSINQKIKLYKIGLVLAVFSTLILAWSKIEFLWLASRIISGFAASMCFVVGSAIVMSKLKIDDKTKAMGIHFSGIGFAICAMELIVQSNITFTVSWEYSWIYITIFGALISMYPIYIFTLEEHEKDNVVKYKINKTIFTPFVLIFIFVYFTEGIGFVVQATFLPDIINSVEGLEGMGSKTWLIVGVSGIFSCILWMRMALRFGYINMIVLAMIIQVVGILIPTLTTNVYLNLLSGVFYGGTFVGLVALFMSLGGKLIPEHPVVLMGSLTTAYGIGQVVAPLYAVALTEHFGSYDYSLYLTASFVLCGALILYITKQRLSIQY